MANALIIVGTDRNAGKTTLACKIIEHNACRTPIIALKISPHFHPIDDEKEVMARSENYMIIRENDHDSWKDSSRFLRSGAAEVYYMQVWDQNLLPAFNAFLNICGPRRTMVIESGWLRNLVEPGMFIIVNRKGNGVYKGNIDRYRRLPHLWVETDGEGFSIDAERIVWEGRCWKLF